MRSPNRFDELIRSITFARAGPPNRPPGATLYGRPSSSLYSAGHVSSLRHSGSRGARGRPDRPGGRVFTPCFEGGDFGRSYSNKLMRLRVVLQFIAIIVLVAAAFWWRRGGA